MKKAGLVVLLMIVLSLIFPAILIHAQDEPPMPTSENNPDNFGNSVINEETGLPKSFDEFQEASEQLSKEEQRKQYLEQEWTKVLADKEFVGPALFYTNKFFTFFNPLWKFILGMEFSWSWIFVLSLIIWIFTLVYILRILQLTSPFSDWVSWIISLGFILVLGITGAVKKMAEGILYIISLNEIWWVQLIIVLATVILFFVAVAFSKQLKEFAKKRKEEIEKEKEKINREKLEVVTKVAEEFTKGVGS